ncbi:hypothetical protein CC1G_04172 [Coprinopsis cinerea okayama7|uniref:Uncharacterized protein n=1 Tax=Coprinopsis cinerea (strain Okayama-7 / 130 / ATCC MYA-4618 / FGSC 9003) TaxID=240176 RepID=A8NW88_COPC7|nr:hypothetical protein CC1G_04172 [Coprinopsis cinerea okayama7\|eukprot:XP_001836859.2 hypothetical protein CC1G_04172 [Coprinopsis cinerea okayama7\
MAAERVPPPDWAIAADPPPGEWIENFPLPTISLPSTVKSVISTTENSKTQPADTTKGVVESHGSRGLHRIYTSKCMLHRLWAYVADTSFSAVPSPYLDPLTPFARAKDRVAERGEGPPRGFEQARADIFSELSAERKRIHVKCNEDVREGLNRHVYTISNHYLRLRYENSILPNADALDLDEASQFINSDGTAIKNGDLLQTDIHAPAWVTPVRDDNRNPKITASGFADRVLAVDLVTPRINPPFLPGARFRRFSVCLGEGKIFWAYPADEFENIFTSPEFLDVDGQFLPSDSAADSMCLLFQQLWGQFHFLGPRVGFVTNMHYVMFLLRDPRPDQKGRLIVSPLMKFTDKRLLTCFVAMTYVAIDAYRKGEDDEWNYIKETLAPKKECFKLTLTGASVLSEHEEELQALLRISYCILMFPLY